MLWRLILHMTGTDNTSGLWYGFWSGFGSDLGEFALIGYGANFIRKHNCHVNGCWRMGRHPVDGTSYKTCHKHLTKTEHTKLQRAYKHKHPAQHALLNEDK